MSTTVLTTIPNNAQPPPIETAETPSETPVATQAPEATNGAETPSETPVANQATEPLEPEKPDPDLEIAKKLESVAKREARVRRIETDLQSKLTSAEEQKKQVEAKLAELESALEDPIAYYMKKGKDPVEIAKRFAKPVSEEEKRLARLEEAEQKREAERKKRDEEARTAEERDRATRLNRQFVADTNPDEYPNLTALYQPKDLPVLVRELLHGPHDPTDSESPTVLQVFRAQYGRVPTDKEIRDALEHRAEVRVTELMSRLKPQAQAAPSQATPTTPPAIEESTSLSNQHAASTSRVSPRIKSREEVLKELKDELEAEASAT